jgi:PPOX class probable F420-dependent enzyme
MTPKTPVGSVLHNVPVEIPESYRDLIDGPYWAALTTVMPDGQPQTTPVWCNREGNYVLTNTMLGFRKEKNMRANPHVDLLIYDPHNPPRNIEIRGLVVEMTEDGAVEHDDRLAQLYTGKPGAQFFGDAVPANFAEKYVPIKVTIAPTHVRVGEPTPAASLRAKSGGPTVEEEAPRAPDTMPAPELIPAHLPVPIPASHRDLLVRPIHGILSTMKFDRSTPDGQPQSSLVWIDYDGTHVLINTALGRQKCRNMQANPKVTLLVVDPNRTDRWVEVRGRVAEITTDGAIAHADMLAQRYMGKHHFYGDVYEVEWQHYETRVIVRIEPVRVSLDAVFK